MNINRVKKCLAAKIPWQYKAGILVFSDGRFNAKIILDNDATQARQEIFDLLGLPPDYNSYSHYEMTEAEKEMMNNIIPSDTYKGKVPTFRSSISGLECRSKLIQKYILALSQMDSKTLKRNIPKVIEAHNEWKKNDWSRSSELEINEDKLIKLTRRLFSFVIKLDKDACYNTHLEAFIVALKDCQLNNYKTMPETVNKKETIFITSKGIRGNAIMDYNPVLDEAIANWEGENTVKRIGNKVFVMNISLHYFIEIARRKANVCVSTELKLPKKKK